MAKAAASPWDLTALFNAADNRASLAERNLWVIRLVEWLRKAPLEQGVAPEATPAPTLRLRHLLGVLERNPVEATRVAEMLRIFLHRAIRLRLRREPLSFIVPPAPATATR